MATMYVGGGLYLPTTGTASKPKTTSTPTGGTVTVAQRNAIASKTKPATTTAAKKPTTNTLSSMAGSSLGTTSTPRADVTRSLVSTPSSSSARTTNPLSTMAGRTLGINAALPQPPQLTKAQIGNRFTQSLAAGAKTGAAVPNPAGLTRDEADTFRSQFYKQFYSGQPVQRIVDNTGAYGRGVDTIGMPVQQYVAPGTKGRSVLPAYAPMEDALIAQGIQPGVLMSSQRPVLQPGMMAEGQPVAAPAAEQNWFDALLGEAAAHRARKLAEARAKGARVDENDFINWGVVDSTRNLLPGNGAPVAAPGRGIDAVPAVGITPAQLTAIRQVTPAAYYPGAVSSSLTNDEAAALARQFEEDAALRKELGITVDGAAPTAVADVQKVMPIDRSLTAQMAEDAEAAFMDPVEVAKREAATNRPEGSEFGSSTSLQPEPTAASGEQGEGTAPAAGKKFTPGPGQFVGTNGYIYEQSSDGSFKNVGRVPGYTPAQLSEAANKGAFRDPNNIVTGGAKPRKQVKKTGEKNFIDKAGDILKERFDDSLFARLFLNQDDEAAPEAVATGPEAVEYYSTPPSSVPESLVSSSGSSKKRKKKDEDETDGGTGTGGTGTGGTGTGTYTPPTQAMIDALYAPYMRQYTGPGAGYVPGVNPEWNYFTPAFADGGLVDGRLVLGDGGPKEDKIPATIDGVEQAKLSNGEFVMTAAAVKNAGGGDIELGAKRLMDLNNMLSYGRPAERLKVQHVK